jgi:hypothetical protein
MRITLFVAKARATDQKAILQAADGWSREVMDFSVVILGPVPGICKRLFLLT